MCYVHISTCRYVETEACVWLQRDWRSNARPRPVCGVVDRVYQREHYVLAPSRWNKSSLSFRYTLHSSLTYLLDFAYITANMYHAYCIQYGDLTSA